MAITHRHEVCRAEPISMPCRRSTAAGSHPVSSATRPSTPQESPPITVKRADLEDNYRLSRTILRPERIEPDLERVRKYLLAYKFLTDMLTEEQYRAAMQVGC
jgi:hypothetical protein